MARRLYFIIYLLMVLVSAKGQTASQLTREGNRLFSSKRYAQAEVLYRKAVDKDPGNAIAGYNLGRSLQAQKKNDEARKQYEKAARLEKDPVRQASSYNNLGTVFQGEKEYAEAIEAYKEALRNNPADNETRYNLALCKHLQKKQPPKKQPQNKQDDKKEKDKNKDNQKDKQDKNKQNQQQNKPSQEKMSKENAEQLLNAAMQEEQNTQQRLKKAMSAPRSRRLLKNW